MTNKSDKAPTPEEIQKMRETVASFFTQIVAKDLDVAHTLTVLSVITEELSSVYETDVLMHLLTASSQFKQQQQQSAVMIIDPHGQN